MTAGYQHSQSHGGRRLDAGKLWAGGIATALVAALIAVVGILVARGLFGITILGPEEVGLWDAASMAWYAAAAAVGGLLATALVQLLVAFTPRPMRFFAWVMALATAGATLAPLATEAEIAAKLATATLNLILGVAIGSLVAGTARGAIPSATRRTDRWAPEG